jgi:hypothetical protein
MEAPEEVNRPKASEDELSSLHGSTAQNLSTLMQDEDVKVKLAAISLSIKFLKDNHITAGIRTSPTLKRLEEELPTPEELERIMRNSPD